MTRKDAIEAIKCNWPDSRYTILREALDMAVKALEDVTDKNVGKMTNADRIRAMSDEELALWICGVYDIEEEHREGYYKMIGSFYISNPFSRGEYYLNGGKMKPRKINFCPMCGRSLCAGEEET